MISGRLLQITVAPPRLHRCPNQHCIVGCGQLVPREALRRQKRQAKLKMLTTTQPRLTVPGHCRVLRCCRPAIATHKLAVVVFTHNYAESGSRVVQKYVGLSDGGGTSPSAGCSRSRKPRRRLPYPGLASKVEGTCNRTHRYTAKEAPYTTLVRRLLPQTP